MTITKSAKKTSPFMKPKSVLSCSQELSICPYSKPNSAHALTLTSISRSRKRCLRPLLHNRRVVCPMRLTCLTISPCFSTSSQQYLVTSTTGRSSFMQTSPGFPRVHFHVSTHLPQHFVLRTLPVIVLPSITKDQDSDQFKEVCN
jgi:hypothetical protein